MNQLSAEQQLMVLLRIEAGCLGPEGETHVIDFCHYAEQQMNQSDYRFIRWQVTPRTDKTLPEIEYRLLNKRLSVNKIEKYLNLFDVSTNEIESHLQQTIAPLIESYFQQ